MSLKQKVIHGVSWGVISRLGTQFFSVAFSIVLARVLNPDDFGTIGMLAVFVGFIQILGDSGFSYALVQNQAADERHFSTVFWLQLAIGAVLSAAFFFAAPLIAAFYSKPILEPLTRLICSTFFISALGYTHQAILTKSFRFKKLAVLNLVSICISGVAAVILALYGYGLWALAWQPVVAAVVTTGLLWVQSAWKPRFLFDRAAAMEVGKYGAYLLGHMSLNYWLRNGDNLLIGKFLGAAPLGIYARAYNLMLLPINNISNVLGQVMFPALSQLQTDILRFKGAYLRAVRMVALVAFPLMIGMAVLAEPLILLLYGNKWAEVIPILRILSVVGLFQSVVTTVVWIFTALGKTKTLFKLSMFLGLGLVTAIFFGLRYGIVGVAFAYALIAVPSGLLTLKIAGRYIQLPLREVLTNVAKMFLMASLMGIVIFACDTAGCSGWPLALRLLTDAFVGATVYVGLCSATKDETFSEAFQIVSRKISQRSVTASGAL